MTKHCILEGMYRKISEASLLPIALKIKAVPLSVASFSEVSLFI